MASVKILVKRMRDEKEKTYIGQISFSKELLEASKLLWNHKCSHVLLKGLLGLLERDRVAAVAQVHFLKDVLEDLVGPLLNSILGLG